MKNIANIINSILAYEESKGTTNNPKKRNVDWTRSIENISINNPKSNAHTLAPDEIITLFDGTRVNPLDGTSVLDLALVDADESRYRISVTSGTSGFRTARSVSAIGAVEVTVNNGVTATFDFTGATVTAVQVGDIMRIKSTQLKDTSPFIFNALNGGLWIVIGIVGTKVTVMRETGCDFEGIAESVTGASGDVEFYAPDGIRTGDRMQIDGTFSIATQRTYEVLDSTPTQIDFISTIPLPEETGLSYVPSSIVFYSDAKTLLYIEADQEAGIRINEETTDRLKIIPQNVLEFFKFFI